MKLKVLAAALCAAVALCLIPVARAADADVTGLVPTIWWDFETQPAADGLTAANKGSASISFSDKGTASYAAGVTNGWALNTDGFSPYSAAGGNYSTAGNAFTVSAVMTLGTRANGVTLNVRCETAEKDLVIRRGAEAGSLVIGLGPQKADSTQFLNATFADGDTAFHLVSIVAELSGTSLYVDGNLVTNTTEFSLCHASGCASRMQFGERLSANQSGEVQYGGLIDDFRIHDAALTPAQMQAIAAEYGLVPLAIAPFGEPTIDKDSFRMPFNLLLNEGDAAEAAIVYGTDAALSTPSTNVVGSTLSAGNYTASLTGLASSTTYWWKIVASNGVDWVESDVASFHTLDAVLEPVGDYMSFTATVDWDGDPVENVPVLLRLSETAISGFRYSDVLPSRFEILDSDGRLLPYEIDTWNTDGESLVWVLLRDYRDGATFTVRYGAPFANAPLPASDVWAGYKGVWHMDSVDPADSTTNGFGGTNKTANLSVAVGKIGSAVNVPRLSSSDGISCGNVIANSELTGGFTVEGWCRPTQYGSVGEGAALFGKNAFVSVRIASATRVTVTTPGKSDHHMDLASGVLPAVGEWWHFTVTFRMNTSGNGLNFYVNGQLVKSQDAYDISDKTSTSEMFLGRNQWGDQSFKGDLDEMRLCAGIRSANEIAAEYHAMADASALVCSAATSSDVTAPVLATPTVARNQDGSFTVSVEVTENFPAAIVCSVAGADYTMTTPETSLPATYAAIVSGIASGTYQATVRAEADSGTIVSAACPTVFHIGALTVTAVSNADEGTLTPGVFRVSRADADATDLPALSFDVAYSGEGVAAVVPNSATATIPAGAASVDISVVPVFTMDVTQDADLTLAVTGANIGQASSATMTVVNATFDPSVRYVATTGDDANHGGTPVSPKKTIGAAIESLAAIVPTHPCTVHVAPGLYPISNPIFVTNSISVIGDDPDPSRVAVSNTVGAGYYNQDQRIFRIDHAGAIVANLTMQKGQDYGHGGNFHIGSAGGTVSNCVVEAGYTRDNGKAGGAWLDAGVVTHTVFRKNNTSSGTVWWNGVTEGILHLGGNSRAENCLFDNNSQWVTVTLISVGGSATLRNCSIVNTGLSATNSDYSVWSALKIDSGATVQNVVIAGVTNSVDGAACPPTGAVENFQNGAFDGNVTGLPTGTITGTAAEFFEDYANGGYTPSVFSPLANAGVEYEGMAATDLAGKKRKSGKHIDIGCYECQKTPGLFIFVR